MKEKEKRICSVCGAEIVGDDVCEFDDKVMCRECFEGGTTICDCCGVRIWSDDAQGDSGVTLCNRCYEYNYTTCEGCGRLISNDDAMYEDRGDSPLSMIHFPKYKLYVYASTDEILYKAIVETKLFEEIKNGRFEEIDINSGDILNILSSGEIIRDRFNYMEYIGIGRYNWWDYTIDNKANARKSYIEELKAIATYQGVSPDEIDELLNSGFTLDEIEDYIYCME